MLVLLVLLVVLGLDKYEPGPEPEAGAGGAPFPPSSSESSESDAAQLCIFGITVCEEGVTSVASSWADFDQGAGLLDIAELWDWWLVSCWEFSPSMDLLPQTVVCPTGTSVTLVSLPLFSRRRLDELTGAGAVVLVTGRCNTNSLPCWFAVSYFRIKKSRNRRKLIKIRSDEMKMNKEESKNKTLEYWIESLPCCVGGGGLKTVVFTTAYFLVELAPDGVGFRFIFLLTMSE
jgi:hypothetical protein